MSKTQILSYHIALTNWGVTSVVIRSNKDGSPFNDGGKTPCRVFFHQETLGL